jgi:hypothetical protein
MPLSTLLERFAQDDALSVSFHQLAHYPDVAPDVLCHHARAIGQAGESLVDSLLLRHGLVSAHLPDGNCADRLLLLPRTSLKLQIKTRTRPSPSGYVFRMKKGFRASGDGCRPYEAGDYDIAALVALPRNAVMFTAAQGATLTIPHDRVPKISCDPLCSLAQALADLDARAEAPEPL